MEKTLAIQSESGAHFGFILFSGGPSFGDCIIQSLPRNVEAFEVSAFKYLEDYGFRNVGEHRWSREGEQILLNFSTGGSAVIDLARHELSFDSGPTFKIGQEQAD